MKFTNKSAGIFIPDGLTEAQALERTTLMGIGAHQDDLEFMALHAIQACYQNEKKWFTGVTVTDGRGSARANEYADYTDDQMVEVRRREQNKAAFLGEYSAMISLDYPSAAIKKPGCRELIEELKTLLLASSPEVVYTHNPADKHDTHVAVFAPVLQAIRELPEAARPKKLYGCEVWRTLDWMLDEDKATFNVSDRENLSSALMGVFDSQISGGKRYDIATYGRKKANATYFASHQTDASNLMEFAMDLTPLIRDPSMNVATFVTNLIRRFEEDVQKRLSKFLVQ